MIEDTREGGKNGFKDNHKIIQIFLDYLKNIPLRTHTHTHTHIHTAEVLVSALRYNPHSHIHTFIRVIITLLIQATATSNAHYGMAL